MGDAVDEVWSGPTRTFAFPVEAGHVLGFERAIGARASADGVAPPTFVAATDHYDPAFDRRPPLGQGWGLGLPASHLHVEQHFAYLRPLRAGDVLVARRGPGRVWEKLGRSGRLRFVEERTELVDHDGECVQVMRWVDVHAERTHEQLTNAQRAGGPTPAPHPPEGTPVVVAADLSRTQFVMYAGASGDFHPLHHDDDLAHRHGYPSVFCPGMLTMALSCRALDGIVATSDLRSISSRFRGQVWPGDSLTVFVHEVGGGPATGAPSADGRRELALVTRNQLGAVVLESTVHVTA
jgi:acyl dehydratase